MIGATNAPVSEIKLKRIIRYLISHQRASKAMRRPVESTLRQIIDDPGPATEKKLGEALRYAVNRCDLRLLDWLAGVTGPSVSRSLPSIGLLAHA